MSEVKQVWSNRGNKLFLDYESIETDFLENAIYKVGYSDFMGFFLTKHQDSFNFNYKLYGLETKLINQVIKTYENTDSGNLGVLLNGLKGTGKTVSSKVIANKLNQPVILVDRNLGGIHTFLNSIPQNITIFIDEYEKIFGESSEMLTIMDGALSSQHRRVFLLTTNKLYVDDNLIQRPSRIRYLKKFEDLTPSVIEEIIDDMLLHTKFKHECLSFISSLENITVDIVKELIKEVNIHEEEPNSFAEFFNVTKIRGKFNIFISEDNVEFTEMASDITIYPKPNYNERNIGHRFEVDGSTIGVISDIVGKNVMVLEPLETDNGVKVGFEQPIYIKVVEASSVNYNFKYDDVYAGVLPTKNKKISDLAVGLMNEVQKYYNDGEDYKNEVVEVQQMQSEELFSEGESSGPL
jgi:hypothetical protein